MDIDSATYAVNNEHLPVDETDGSCMIESISADWSDEVRQENLTVVKQEPHEVCCVICVLYIFITEKVISLDP